MRRIMLFHRWMPSLANGLLVAMGGALGSGLRYCVGLYVERWYITLPLWLPIATLLVNVIGSFFIGLFFSLSQQGRLSHALSLLITVGGLGGLTTFSSFALECMELLRRNQWRELLFYSLISIVIACFMVWLGMKLGARFS